MFSQFAFQHWVALACIMICTAVLFNTKKWNYLFAFIVINFIVDCIACHLANLGQQTHHVYSIVLNCLIIGYFMIYYKNSHLKSLISSFGIIYIVCSIINLVFFQQLKFFNTFTLIPGSLFIFIFTFLLLRNIIIHESFVKSNKLHWLLIANLVYFGLNVQSLAPTLATVAISNKTALAFLQFNYIAYTLWILIMTTGFYFTANEK